MKFITYKKLLLAITVISSMAFVLSFEGKAKRSESMMEYINGFFSDTSSYKANKHQDHHVNNHHNHKKNKKHHYRFKESGRFENITGGQSPPASSGAAPANNTSSQDNGGDSSPILSEWFMISSATFRNTNKFPLVTLWSGKKLKIKTDSEYFRINDAFFNSTGGDKGPSEKFFWFRLSGLNIYYSLTQSDMNILGAIAVKAIGNVASIDGSTSGGNQTYCFSVADSEATSWKICGLNQNTTNQWVCQIKKLLGYDDPSCDKNGSGNSTNSTNSNTTIVEKNITQPIIIIPLPSRQCNEGWNYQLNGDDWECECAEGREQAPIDLPAKEAAIDSPVRPLFQYDEVSSSSKESTGDGQLKENKPMKIKLMDNSMKILHNKFGKVVTMDGAVYHAQEIIIHTPAEHTIQGKTFDMEVQVIHYGVSKGDIAKQIILCFIFEKVPGVYNKFIDDLDMFNLPNPITKERELTSNIFIPKILYSADDNDIPVMKPFSFYTYQGSLTAPPCTENTIMYVAAKPIPLGSTAIQLFQEALRVPDLMDEKGNMIVSNWVPKSNRNIQPLNGRPVFYYGHEKYCGPDPSKSSSNGPEGHYEKIMKAMTNYFYVTGKEPSGIPNAFVVSEKEALGREDTDDKNSKDQK
jgi:carbonic anhydrase